MNSKPFSLGVDLRATEVGFKSHHGRGTGRYATELIKHLVQEVEEHPGFTGDLEFLSNDVLSASLWEKNLISLAPLGKRTLESQILFPRRMKASGVDVVHFFAHGDAPAFSSTPFIVTVLDLIPLRFKELYKADKPSWRFHLARALEKKSIRNATGLLAISEATKKDLNSILGIPLDNVHVSHLACGEEFKPISLSADSWSFEKKARKEEFSLDIDRPTLLYVGGIDQRKNVGFMLKVFSELVKLYPNKSDRPVLVMAGNYQKEDSYPKLIKQIKNLGLEQDVKLLGFISNEALPKLYQTADLFIFPSLYEGFGLPVLEAMACGTPVVAGNNSSIPEVAGSAGELLADNDLQAWVSSIKNLLDSESSRLVLASEGLKRVDLFSWKKTAISTLDAYARFSKELSSFVPLNSSIKKNAA